MDTSTISSTVTEIMSSTNATTMATQEDPQMEMAKKMHWGSSVIFGTIFVVVGLIGNTLSILVWSRRKMRCSTGIYLIAQAIADTGLLIFFFITDSIKMMDPTIVQSYSYGVFFCYIGYPFFFLFVILSIWFTVGVTVDRYIQICWFMYAKKMCNHKKAFVGIGIITLLCFIINIPHFSTFTTNGNWQEDSEEASFLQSEFGKGEGSQRYEFWVHCMFLVLAPVVSIFTLNVLIISKVAKMNRQMKDTRGEKGLEKAKKSETQLTRLLLTVTFTFLVLIAFQCIVQCFFMLQPETVNFALVSEAFSIAKLGIVINSSVNFYLYCLSAKRFRDELWTMLCRGRYADRELLSSSMRDTSSSVISRSKASVKKSMSSV